MSMNLYWRPVPTNKIGLDDALKFALRKRYGGCVGGVTMDYNDIGYLNGLKDAGIDGAETLIDAIEKHDEIYVFEE